MQDRISRSNRVRQLRNGSKSTRGEAHLHEQSQPMRPHRPFRVNSRLCQTTRRAAENLLRSHRQNRQELFGVLWRRSKSQRLRSISINPISIVDSSLKI